MSTATVCAAKDLRPGQVLCLCERCVVCEVREVDGALRISAVPVGGGVRQCFSAAPDDGFRLFSPQ